MHHDFLFLVTHLSPNSNDFLNILNYNTEICFNNDPLVYNNCFDLHYLKTKCEDRRKARIYGDIIFFNQSLHTKDLFGSCYFIYFFDDPIDTLDYLINYCGYDIARGIDHYRFRLQRLNYMISHNQNKFIIKKSELNKQTYSMLKDFLNLRNDISPKPINYTRKSHFDNTIIDKLIKIYNKYTENLDINQFSKLVLS